MKFIYSLLITLLLASPTCLCQDTNTYNSEDQAALKALPVKWEKFWNSHDMDAMGTMLKDDVDFVNVAGIWLKGRMEAVRDHKQKHQTIVFKNSVWKTDSVAIKYLKEDIAIMHIGWQVSGDNDPDGTPRKSRHGIFTWVVVKDKKAWVLQEVHNVNIRETILPTK